MFDITLISILILLGYIALLVSILNNGNPGAKMIILPLIFYIVVNSNSDRLLRPLFIVSLFFILLEIILFYTELRSYLPFHIPTLSRFNLVRPHGLFFEVHVTSLFIASTLYLFGRKYMGGMSSLLFMSLQTALAYLVVFFKKRYIFSLVLFLVILLYIVSISSAHLDINSKHSMVSVYYSLIDIQYNACFIYGCASNIADLTDLDSGYILYRGYMEEIGFLRILYYYGVLWLLVYFWLIMRLSSSVVLPVMYFMVMVHYPVVFGLLTTALLALSINYYNKKIVNQLI